MEKFMFIILLVVNHWLQRNLQSQFGELLTQWVHSRNRSVYHFFNSSYSKWDVDTIYHHWCENV